MHRLGRRFALAHQQGDARLAQQVGAVRGQCAHMDEQAALLGVDRVGHHGDERRTVCAQRAQGGAALVLQQLAQRARQAVFIGHVSGGSAHQHIGASVARLDHFIFGRQQGFAFAATDGLHPLGGKAALDQQRTHGLRAL